MTEKISWMREALRESIAEIRDLNELHCVGRRAWLHIYNDATVELVSVHMEETGMSLGVYHNVILTIALPNHARPTSVADWLDDPLNLTRLEKIFEGMGTEWIDTNEHGTLDEEASEAFNELEAGCDHCEIQKLR